MTELLVAAAKSHAEPIGNPLHVAVGGPEQSTVEKCAREKVNVDVGHSCADNAIFPREPHDLFVGPRRWTDEGIEIAKCRCPRPDTETELELGEHQRMNLSDALTEKADQALRGGLPSREGEPDLRVNDDQGRTRRRRGAAAISASNSPASRSATSCRFNAWRPSSTTSVRVVGRESFRRRRSSRTALIAWSNSATSISSVVRTAPTITPASEPMRFSGHFSTCTHENTR